MNLEQAFVTIVSYGNLEQMEAVPPIFLWQRINNKLKTSIYNDVRKICREVGIYLNMEYESGGLDIISELTWQKLKGFALDLEAFEKHGKRSTINADDVKLLVRNNDALKKLVDDKIKEMAAAKAELKIGKRKRKSSPDKS